MNTQLIITAVVILAVIGAIAALVLAIASKIFAVPVDEKAEKIRHDNGTTYEQKVKKTKKLLKKFVDYCIKEYDKD